MARSLCAGSITTYSLYAPRFLTRLHYTQLQVNGISIAAEVGLYLLVPFFGYLCDRYSPRPLSLLSSVLFGFGYLLAAFVYRAGPPPSDSSPDGHGFPCELMAIAFVAIGAGTSCMYLSGVATCAKNSCKSKHGGLILAFPIAAFGLSGMWQSQIGAHLLQEPSPAGDQAVLDVFRYFLFLGILLMLVGLLGTFGLTIVNEDELIERGWEEAERSGLLESSDMFDAQGEIRHHYGTIENAEDPPTGRPGAEMDDSVHSKQKPDGKDVSLRLKKVWLLNHETRSFLSDGSMWLLAAGFFLVTGPGEAYINNVGTIIETLTPRIWSGPPPAGEISTHVSLIAVTSTVARLFTGFMVDVFTPRSSHSASSRISNNRPSNQMQVSRMVFLLPSAFLLCIGYLTMSILPLLPAADTDPSFLLATSALVGFGYGACFSLVPLLISVVWGVGNFATNWGIVAIMPAPGAALWSVVYSLGYAAAMRKGNGQAGDGDNGKEGESGQCHSSRCFAGWAWGCAGSVALATLLWGFAWRIWKRRGVVV